MSNLHSKKYFLILLIIGVGLFIGKVGLLLVVDPLQIFHKPWVREEYFIPKMRFQAAGIINHNSFDSIILGTSIAANFSAKEASKLWGDEFVNISPDGSLLSERSLILNYALKKKILKNVVISLDGYAPVNEYNADFSESNFNFLYNDSVLDDIKVYLNDKYIKYIRCKSIFPRQYSIKCSETNSIEKVTSWSWSNDHMDRFGGIDKWFKAKNNEQIRKAFSQIVSSAHCIEYKCEELRKDQLDLKRRLKAAPNAFDSYIFAIARNSPETNFYLFFPPYSRLVYGMWKQENPEVFDLYITYIKHAVERAEEHKNIQIFGFDHLSFLDNLKNYKDPLHYHPIRNSELLEYMEAGNFMLTKNNLDTYLTKINALSEMYDVNSIGLAIERYLDNE
jgi:hypothetical protein